MKKLISQSNFILIRSFGMSDDLKKDVTKFDSNDGEKNNKSILLIN